MLGALVCAVVGLLLALVISIFVNGWPSFAHNGLSWFGPGGNVDQQLRVNYLSGEAGAAASYTFSARPLVLGTSPIVGSAVTSGPPSPLFFSGFFLQCSPAWVREG